MKNSSMFCHVNTRQLFPTVILGIAATLVIDLGLLSSCGKVKNPSAEENKNTPTATVTAPPDGTIASPTPPAPGSLVLAKTLSIPDGTASLVRTSPTETALPAGIVPGQFIAVSATGQTTGLNIFVSETSLTRSSLTSPSVPVAAGLFVLPSFVLFRFAANDICNLVVLRKSDSRLFCAEKAYAPPDYAYYGGEESIRSDSSENIYYINKGSAPQLIRLDLNNPTAPTRSILDDGSAGLLTGFILHPSGDLLVTYGIGSGGTFIKKSNGGLQNISANNVKPIRGIDDAFFYDQGNDIAKLTRQPDGTYVETIDTPNANLSLGQFDQFCRTTTEVFAGASGTVSESFGGIKRLLTNRGTIHLEQEGYAALKKLRCTKTAALILGSDTRGDSIIKFYNPVNGEFSTVLSPGEFTVFTAEGSASNDAVFFNALRNVDGAKVFGKVATPGAPIEIISTTFFKAEELKPLN